MDGFSLAVIIQLFVLLNPLTSLPFLVAARQKKLDVEKIALKAIGVAFLIAVIIIFVGPLLFDLFGIRLDSFRIAAGVVLLLLGLHMVNPRDETHHEHFKGVNGLITIIATPLLTGPATISFLTIKVYEFGKLPMLLNVSIAFIFVGIVFMLFSFMIEKVNMRIADVASRVLGLFLTAVAIEMVAAGIEGLILAS